MPKRKQLHKRKKLLRRLKPRKPRDPAFVYVSKDPGSKYTWLIKVKAERKEPDDYDKKALAYAALETAADQQIQEAEEELVNLKGDRTKQATAKRKELKTKIEHLHRFKRRLGMPTIPPMGVTGYDSRQ